MYNLYIQRMFITIVLSSPELYKKCKKIFKSDFFAPEVRHEVKFIISYDNEYNAPPSAEIVNAECSTDYKIVPIKESEKKWFLDQFQSFAMKMSVSNAITESASMIRDGNYDQMLQLINDSLKVKLDSDYGLDYGLNPLERLTNIKNRSGNLTSGYSGIDMAVGKVNAGDLVIFVGGSGSGKSLFLQNLSRIHWSNGRNVLYITLELHPELCARRMDAMLLNTTTEDLYQDLSCTSDHIKEFAKKAGTMNIKYMPSGSKTSEIRAFIEDYMVETNKKVDVICIDYLDLLNPVQKVNTGDTFHKDKFVAEELRNMMQEFGILTFTASQTNRNAVDSTDGLNHSHIAGGISKINTADLVLGILTDATKKAQGEIELQALKVRNGVGTGRRIKLRYNEFTMRIDDDNDYLLNFDRYKNNAPVARSDNERVMNHIQNTLNNNNKDYDPIEIETGKVVPNGMVSGRSMDSMNRIRALLGEDE
jgi:replicative DNA helicase